MPIVRTCAEEASIEDHINLYRSRWHNYKLGWKLLISWSYYSNLPRGSLDLQFSVIASKISGCGILVSAKPISQKGWFPMEEEGPIYSHILKCKTLSQNE